MTTNNQNENIIPEQPINKENGYFMQGDWYNSKRSVMETLIQFSAVVTIVETANGIHRIKLSFRNN